jgi:DNA-binding XRE family transcriptional regulator
MLKPRIKILMLENELTRDQVAEAVGVTPDQVSRWSTGNSYPRMDKAFALARLFKCKVDDLYKYEEDNT